MGKWEVGVSLAQGEQRTLLDDSYRVTLQETRPFFQKREGACPFSDRRRAIFSRKKNKEKQRRREKKGEQQSPPVLLTFSHICLIWLVCFPRKVHPL